MNLHHDKDAFTELIVGAANELAIPTNVIEKDYYVTITLKALSKKVDDLVFKGGTSLTKCYQLLDRFLDKINRLDLAETYDLMPFEITTQTIERTLVDKVFALCDYYMQKKTERHSRHLYDIHRIVERVGISNELAELIPEVRAVRSEQVVCPSAKDGVSVSDVLLEIIESNIYKSDYESITMGLLFVPVEYDIVIQSLQKILDSGLWD